MTNEEIAKALSEYQVLTTTISATLKAYKSLLKDHETDLKQYITDDIPLPLIKVQELLIIKLKAKIEVLTDLNK